MVSRDQQMLGVGMQGMFNRVGMHTMYNGAGMCTMYYKLPVLV